MKRLIVTADDFGLSTEVNEAVEIAHRHGILTSASLMVGAPAAPDAVARARRLPKLRVGLHLVLTDGRAVSPPRRIPKLAAADGNFRSSMVFAAVRMAADPGARTQLSAEIEAQFEAYAATGLPLDHVDCHKHFHLNPVIGRRVIAIGQRYGMTALRLPYEPPEIIRRSGDARFDPLSHVNRICAAYLERRIRKHRLRAADRVFGLEWSGAMTQARVLALLEHLPEGVSEMYFHPATSNGFAGAVPGYRYGEELAALIDPAVAKAMSHNAIQLAGYSDLAMR